MKYCSSCGNPIEDNSKFCSVCGAPSSTAQERKTERNKDSDFRSNIEDAFNNFNNTPETTADYAPDDIEKNKIMAIFAYLGLLFLIPLFAAKESPFARYHTNQGILLFIVQFIGSVCGAIPFIGWLIAAAANVFSVLLIVLGIINVIKGQAKELPLIGKYRILK
ncbi:MAG: zinc-ribbon domain-containing protein [Clostridia bacterium]|nr:zinc-ribbon domain-containing protein [Clostridia bacterium]